MDLKNINIDLKNINLEDIKSKLLAIDKKTYIKFGIGAGSIIFFLIIYYAILNPIVNKKKIQLDDMQTKQQEIVTFDQEINSAKAKIKKLKPEYKNYSTLFHSKSLLNEPGITESHRDFQAYHEIIEYKKKGDEGILLKLSKYSQSDQLDIPVIGFNTVKLLKLYNYEGAFLEKERCIIIDKKKVIDYCNQNSLFLSGIDKI